MSGLIESTETSHEVVVERDVMVAMRDGVRLATDIYRPARDGVALAGRFPVILERTPTARRSPRARRSIAA
jgi:predicted acyl esterase